MKNIFSIILGIISLQVSAQIEIDTVKAKKINFYDIKNLELLKGKVTDTIYKPYGFIIQNEDDDSYFIAIKKKHNFQVFEIDSDLMANRLNTLNRFEINEKG